MAAPTAAQDADPADGQNSQIEGSETAPVLGATLSELEQLRQDVASERATLAAQIRSMQEQQQRLESLERRLSLALGEDPQAQDVRLAQQQSSDAIAATPSQRTSAPQQASRGVQSPQNAVGVAPEDIDTQPEIASLGRQGSAITQEGKLTGEVEFSYARADRNRALFRGVEVVESVLVGVFDINESRQDVVTSTIGLQYGLTNDLEIGFDVPLVSRWDTSVLTPVAGPGENGEAEEIDNSANAFGVGDVQLSVRKQLHAPRGFGPYIIGNLQATIPTGTGPFEVARNELGEASEAATGSGFWSLSPGLTAIIPSDPGVLFGSISYTKNFASDVDVQIPPVRISRVDPGDSISFSAGVGLALNPRLSLNFGYAHSWGFGTETTTVAVEGESEPTTQTSRDLQVGRFLFGTTYKVNSSTSINFGLEAGLTDDATDLRAVLRIPFVL
ncbi:MAG: transporter [Erythrobacter sp.]